MLTWTKDKNDQMQLRGSQQPVQGMSPEVAYLW